MENIQPGLTIIKSSALKENNALKIQSSERRCCFSAAPISKEGKHEMEKLIDVSRTVVRTKY